MSNDAATTYRALSALVTPVDAKIAIRKDPTKPYVGLENIPSRGAHLTGWALASASISTNAIFRAGDVLFGKLRPNLRKCIVAPFDGYCSTDILVLRSNEGVDPSFAGKVLRTERVGTAAEMTSVGTKMPRTSWKHLSELEVFCPGFREQSKIAQVLDTIDTAIHETEAIIAKLKAVKQGLLHDLLTRGIAANGEMRPPHAEAPHLYTNSPLGWIPSDWSVARLADLLSEPPRNGLYKPPHLIGSGTLLVGQTAFTEEGSVKFDLARRAQIEKTDLAAFGLRAGDLLVSRVFATLEGVGQPVIVPEFQEDAVYESNMMRLRVREGVVTSSVLFNVLKQPATRAALRSRAFLSNQASINRQGICSIVLPLPPWEEQQAIDERVAALADQLRHEANALTKYRAQKFGLMDDLLTGRVRVTPLLSEADQQEGSA